MVRSNYFQLCSYIPVPLANFNLSSRKRTSHTEREREWNTNTTTTKLLKRQNVHTVVANPKRRRKSRERSSRGARMKWKKNEENCKTNDLVFCVMQIVKYHVLLCSQASEWVRARARSFALAISLHTYICAFDATKFFQIVFFFTRSLLFFSCMQWECALCVCDSVHRDRFDFWDFNFEAFSYNLLESIFAHSCKRDCLRADLHRIYWFRGNEAKSAHIVGYNRWE